MAEQFFLMSNHAIQFVVKIYPSIHPRTPDEASPVPKEYGIAGARVHTESNFSIHYAPANGSAVLRCGNSSLA